MRTLFSFWQVLLLMCLVPRPEWYFHHGVSCAKVWSLSHPSCFWKWFYTLSLYGLALFLCFWDLGLSSTRQAILSSLNSIFISAWVCFSVLFIESSFQSWTAAVISFSLLALPWAALRNVLLFVFINQGAWLVGVCLLWSRVWCGWFMILGIEWAQPLLSPPRCEPGSHVCLWFVPVVCVPVLVLERQSPG